MLSSQEEQAERRSVMLQDARLREQSQTGTYLSHTHSEMGGRFAAIGNAPIVGQGASYPAAGAHQRDPVPAEPPLGYSVDALEPSAALLSSSVEQTGPTSDDPPLGRGVGPSFEEGDPAGVHFPNPPGTRVRAAGSLPIMKRRKL